MVEHYEKNDFISVWYPDSCTKQGYTNSDFSTYHSKFTADLGLVMKKLDFIMDNLDPRNTHQYEVFTLIITTFFALELLEKKGILVIYFSSFFLSF